jgi:hypothetical protein
MHERRQCIDQRLATGRWAGTKCGLWDRAAATRRPRGPGCARILQGLMAHAPDDPAFIADVKHILTSLSPGSSAVAPRRNRGGIQTEATQSRVRPLVNQT